MEELTMEDYKKLYRLISIQLNGLYIKNQDREDFIHEAMIYIIKRCGVIDLEDKYIYGNIKNGLINYLKKYIAKERASDIMMDNGLFGRSEVSLEDEYIYNMLLDDYEYGYLIKEVASGKDIKSIAKDNGLTINKTYYEINKIRKEMSYYA